MTEALHHQMLAHDPGVQQQLCVAKRRRKGIEEGVGLRQPVRLQAALALALDRAAARGGHERPPRGPRLPVQRMQFQRMQRGVTLAQRVAQLLAIAGVEFSPCRAPSLPRQLRHQQVHPAILHAAGQRLWRGAIGRTPCTAPSTRVSTSPWAASLGGYSFSTCCVPSAYTGSEPLS